MHPTKTPYQGFAAGGGTLGAKLLPRTGQRLAGASIPWGMTVNLDTGFTTLQAPGLDTPMELVRASVGGPVAWSIVASQSLVSVGDTIAINARPGLGSGAGVVAIGNVSSVVPMVFFPSPTGLPASELVVSLSVAVALTGPATITVVACPVNWPHWSRGPQTVNP